MMHKTEKIVKVNDLLILLGMITFLGFALRLSFFIGSNFPLHDGGFFYAMVKDLIAHKFQLPEYTTYNQANIPFVYPPLGLYFVGLIETITRVDRLQLFRFIPLLISSLTIPAFYFLALEIIKDKWAALTATTVLSLLPMGYAWLILGGGVTRAFGALFGIIALTFVIRFIGLGGWIDAVLASVFYGFTVLSHPEWAWFLFYSIGIVCILKLITKSIRVVFRLFLLFLGTTAVVLPWLLIVFQRHGKSVIQPLLDNGFSRWSDIINFLFLNWSREPIVPVFTLLAIIGIITLIKKKEWFVVLWLPFTFFLQGRAADQKVVIPLAILAGVGIKATFDFINTRFPERIRLRPIAMIILGIYIYSLVGSMLYCASFIKPLSEQFTKGISWIQKESPIGSTFLVITGMDWTQDRYSEWITALTGRESISVVQGYEWLPGFTDRISRYNQIQYTYSLGMADFVAWIKQNNIHTDYLIFPKGNQSDINNWYYQPALHLDDARFYQGVDVAFENEGILILDLRTLFNH